MPASGTRPLAAPLRRAGGGRNPLPQNFFISKQNYRRLKWHHLRPNLLWRLSWVL
jgi:hypothetical protein